MGKYEDYLQREADYQDLKITQNPRAHLQSLYRDEASKYRARCRDEAIGDLCQKRVLEIGCGDGVASMNALHEGAYVTAIDISPKSIDFLIEQAKEAQLDHHLDARVMDAHQLEFANNSFDLVIGNGILHHLSDLDRAMCEIKRVLKDTGHAVFVEPLGMNPFIVFFRKLTPKCRTSDEKPFTMKELSVVRKYFPGADLTYFECATLFAKIPQLLKLSSLANALQRFLLKVDCRILKGKNPSKTTFLQKMSWVVLMKLSRSSGNTAQLHEDEIMTQH